MKHPNWEQADSRKAKQIWEEYQKQHNLSDRVGQTAGIDPKVNVFGLALQFGILFCKGIVKAWILRFSFNASALKLISAREAAGDLRNGFSEWRANNHPVDC